LRSLDKLDVEVETALVANAELIGEVALGVPGDKALLVVGQLAVLF
jgi:hypothetical protein